MDDFPLLFNVREDLSEMINLADEFPDKVKELKAAYDHFFKYRDRNVMYHSYPFDEKRKIVVYFDPKLQAEEENKID